MHGRTDAVPAEVLEMRERLPGLDRDEVLDRGPPDLADALRGVEGGDPSQSASSVMRTRSTSA